MEPLNVFIVAGGDSDEAITSMFLQEGWKIVDDISEADLVQFGGGEDVHPKFYNEHAHSTTHYNLERDEREIEIYNIAQELGIPCAGICRGGQFLHVMNGGTLYQNVDNHNQTHEVRIPYGGTILVSSVHHQMMNVGYYSDKDERIVLLRSNVSRNREWMTSKSGYASPIRSRIINNNWDDVEAVYYPNTGSLCFQPHPEYKGDYNKACRDIYFHFIRNYCLSNEVEGVPWDDDVK